MQVFFLALYFNLLPEQLRPRAAAELVHNIQSREKHLNTGFVGTPYINGYGLHLAQTDNLAFLALFCDPGCDNYLGALGGWTHDKRFQDPSMNSFSHYAYGAMGAWMYAAIGGIDLDPHQSGYKHIVMHPHRAED